MLKKFYHYSYYSLLLLLLVSCSRSSSQQVVDGYLEGRYTYIATSVAGTLKQLLVTRGDQVKPGQTLFVLEAEPESDAYRAALDNLKQSTFARDAILANLSFAKLTYERYQILVPKGAIQQSQLDNAKSSYQSMLAQLAQANANIATAKANLAQAKWTSGQKIVTAPVAAMVFDYYYLPGEYTLANQAIISLLAPKDIKAIFYVSEDILGALKINDAVTVRCDGSAKNYLGKISFISPTAEYTPPVIYSEKTNAKLIYRIEAEFAAQDAVNLHPGQPIRALLKIKLAKMLGIHKCQLK